MATRNRLPPIPAEALFELERKLSKPEFHGVPIGSTLGDLYNIVLFLGCFQPSLPGAALDTLRRCFHGLERPQCQANDSTAQPGRIVLTWLNYKPYCRDLVVPVVRALGGSRCNVLGVVPSMMAELPTDTGFLTWYPVPRLAGKAWRTEYRACAPIWHNHLRHFLRCHQLPGQLFAHFADTMLIQSQRVIAAHAILDCLQPTALVTEYDRNIACAPLLLAARSRGIPTMTMIHGTINPPYGYTPLLADLAFCWGEQHRSQMISLGTEPERLVITGCQRITRTLDADAIQARAKIGLPEDKPVVMLATNPIAVEERRKLAQEYCEALSSDTSVTAAVRLHPSETLDAYSPQIHRYPNIRFLSNNQCTLDEAIAATSVLVCRDSGMGNDALIKGKPVVILDALQTPLGNGRELIERAGCPHARTATELAVAITRILQDRSYYSSLQQTAEQYVSYFSAAFGEQAADNIAQTIIQSAALHPQARQLIKQ